MLCRLLLSVCVKRLSMIIVRVRWLRLVCIVLSVWMLWLVKMIDSEKRSVVRKVLVM